MKMSLIVFCGILFSLLLLFPKQVQAVKYTVSAPAGTFNQGDDIQFTINIDTEGASLNSSQTDVWLDTRYLQYAGVTAGTLFPDISGQSLTTDTIRISGSVNQGASSVTGSGVFAYLAAKIIAQTSGEANICQIVAPTPTISQSYPTTAPNPTTSYPSPTSAYSQPTPPSQGAPPSDSVPPISELPRSGATENTTFFFVIGLLSTLFGISIIKSK